MKIIRYIISIHASIIVFLCMILIRPVAVEANSYNEKSYSCKAVLKSDDHGKVSVKVVNDFNFINTDSEIINWDLALQGVALSNLVYVEKGSEAKALLKCLGYDHALETTVTESGNADYKHPVSCMSYKKVEDKEGNHKNVFAIVIRGVREETDFGSAFFDSIKPTMFHDSRNSVIEDFKKYIKEATGKPWEQIKSEDNYIFLTGHSWGGATANAMSVDSWIMDFVGGEKSSIYTYTYESPHTCTYYWFNPTDKMSNAFNFKDRDDPVTKWPPTRGSTTYGKDKDFSVLDLDLYILLSLYPDCSPLSKMDHHDLAVDLIYILQQGVAEGWWNSANDVAISVPDDIPQGVISEEKELPEDDDAIAYDNVAQDDDALEYDNSSQDDDFYEYDDSPEYDEVPEGSYTCYEYGFIKNTFTFHGDHQITMNALGVEGKGTYEIKNDELVIHYTTNLDEYFGRDKTHVWSVPFEIGDDGIYIYGEWYYRIIG